MALPWVSTPLPKIQATYHAMNEGAGSEIGTPLPCKELHHISTLTTITNLDTCHMLHGLISNKVNLAMTFS